MENKELPELFYIPASPWSARARIALAIADVRVRETRYFSIVGELPLRWRLKYFTWKRLSVPVLAPPREPVLHGGLAIARWIDRRGGTTPRDSNERRQLIPATGEAQILEWVELADQLQSQYRRWLVEEAVQYDEMLMVFVPRHIRTLGFVGRVIARAGMVLFKWKYADATSAELPVATLFEKLNSALASGGVERYLVGSGVTFADIAMATAVSAFYPVDSRFLRQSPIVKRHAEQSFPDTEEVVLAKRWRDWIFSKHCPE